MELPLGFVTAATRCPTCGRNNHLHSHPEGNPPADGNFYLCWGCRTVGVYAVDPLGRISVRAATTAELAVAADDPDFQQGLFAAAVSRTPLEALRLRRGP